MRRSTDYMVPARLTPQEREVMRLLAERPMTVEQLAEHLGVTRTRIWQVVGRLERPHARCLRTMR